MINDENFSIDVSVKNLGRPAFSKPVHGSIKIKCIDIDFIPCEGRLGSVISFTSDNWRENNMTISMPDEEAIERVGREFLKTGESLLRFIDKK